MAMKKLLNADYWKNAYLLEFKINGALTDAFTFSVPPENEEFNFPQRKSETKTFGGAVVADYGNDLVQISLSGSTINQELKLIYKSKLGSEEMTGKQEIFYLRDLLKKYGERENLQGKEIYLYSLNGGGSNVRSNPKWWKIYVAELGISRSKDKPFCYNYKFSATGEPEVIRKNGYKTKDNFIYSWYNAIKKGIQKMNEICDKFEEYGAGLIATISDAITNARAALDLFNGSVTRYVDIINGAITSAGDVTTDAVMLGDKVLYDAYRYYPSTAASVWNSCLRVRDTFKELGNYCMNMGDEYFSKSWWQQVKELFDDSVSDQDIADVYATLGHQGINYSCNAVATTSKTLNDLSYAIIPGTMNEDDKVIVTYGYKVVTVTEAETSWDQLAQDYYGDSSLSSIIATYNSQSVEGNLKIGQSVLIPKLNFAQSQSLDNEVYNSPDVKDNYGKDLIIKDKDFNVYNGDIDLVDGTENLEQALLNRYSTLVGARIRLEVYGIQASIGDALKVSSSLIQASVHQTTVEDPRVETVEDIEFNGTGDELAVSVTYVDKNGVRQNFGGVI